MEKNKYKEYLMVKNQESNDNNIEIVDKIYEEGLEKIKEKEEERER